MPYAKSHLYACMYTVCEKSCPIHVGEIMKFTTVDAGRSVFCFMFSRHQQLSHDSCEIRCHISSLSVPQTERDVSVRQRAIDLLYAMCDHANAQTIVEELLRYLEKADYSIRETLVCVCVCVCEREREREKADYSIRETLVCLCVI